MEWPRLCDGGKYAPPVLDDGEAATLAWLPSDEDAPLWARGNLPAAVLPLAEAAFGSETDMELAALNGRAPLDLRVNLLKATREHVLEQLRGEEIVAAPTPFSPLGIRSEEHTSELQSLMRSSYAVFCL